jgi:hypothetical protein
MSMNTMNVSKRTPYSGGLVGVGVISGLLLLGISIYMYFLLKHNKGKIIPEQKNKKSAIISLTFAILSILIVILMIVLYVL